MSSLLVLAKAPLPGRVKTRLCPPFTLDEAASLAEAALVDTLHAALATEVDHRILVLEGRPGRWLPEGFEVVPQVQGTLDVRLAGAFAAAASIDPGPSFLIGMDTPQVTAAMLAPDWSGADALFAPADDGGFWAIGFAEPGADHVDGILRGVPMSRSDTGALQLARLTASGLRTRCLPSLRDVDTAADARLVAEQARRGRFAARLAELSVPAAR